MVRKATILAAGMIALAVASNLGAARIVERIIARVNNEIITQRQFDRDRQQLRARLAGDYSGVELEVQVRAQSKDLDINVETEVVKQLDEMRKKYNLASLEEFEKEAEKQGISWEDFKDNIRRDLLMREVIGREVGSRIIVSHEDARKYFNEHKQEFASPEGVRLAEILISPDKHNPPEVEQRTKEALAEIKAGQRFLEVAKKYSDDPNASEGGDVGFFKTGTLAPEIEEAIKKLDTGDTSDSFKTKHGPMIVKVLERRKAGVPNFEDVEQQVMNRIYDQKIQSSLRQYLAKLRKESYIY